MNTILYVGKHALTTSVSRHIHNSWELIYCTGGEGTLYFDDRTMPYRENDVVMIPPYLPHSNKSEIGFTNIHINLDDTAFTFTEPLLTQADSNGFLLDAFRAAFYYYSAGTDSSSLLLQSYGLLIATFLACSQPAHSEAVLAVINDIVHNYMDSNYDLNAYLHSLPFSTDYLKKLFKRETGVTPLQYLINRRLEDAASNLAVQCGTADISETARLCGFKDPLYFSRLFKRKYGVSPSHYRATLPPLEPVTDSDSMKIML